MKKKKKNTRKTGSVSKERWSDTVQRTRDVPSWTPSFPTCTPRFLVPRWDPIPVHIPRCVPVYVPVPVYIPVVSPTYVPVYPSYTYPYNPFPTTHITIC